MAQLLCLFDFVGMFRSSPAKFDMLGNLPLELSTHILRMLDDSSLMKAILVCKIWYDIVYADPFLRRRIKNYYREVRACRRIKENCTPNSDFYQFTSGKRNKSAKVSGAAKAILKEFTRVKRKMTDLRGRTDSVKKIKTMRV